MSNTYIYFSTKVQALQHTIASFKARIKAFKQVYVPYLLAIDNQKSHYGTTGMEDRQGYHT